MRFWVLEGMELPRANVNGSQGDGAGCEENGAGKRHAVSIEHVRLATANCDEGIELAREMEEYMGHANFYATEGKMDQGMNLLQGLAGWVKESGHVLNPMVKSEIARLRIIQEGCADSLDEHET